MAATDTGSSAGEPPRQPANQASTSTISMDEYTVMAEFIQAQDPPVAIPATFCFVLDRVIAVREFYFNTLLPKQSSANQQPENRHAALLHVLKIVRCILAPGYPDGFATRTKAPDCLEELQDLFANIEIDITSRSSTRSLGSLIPPSPPYNEQVKFEAEIPECIEEDFLAVQLLIGDLQRLRSTVVQTWEGYRRGIFDIVTASLITDAAVGLVRSLEEGCKEHIDKHNGIERMLYFIYHCHCLDHDTRPEHKDRPGDDFNFLMYDVADAIFIIPHCFVKKFLEVQQPGTMTEFRRGVFPEYEPTSDRSTKSGRDKFYEDIIIVLKILPEFVALTTEFEPSPAEDEMTRCVRDMLETRKVTLTMAFATQLYLDIHSELRDQVGAAFFTLSTVASFVRKNIKETLEFHKDLRISTWTAEHEQAMKDLSNNIFTYVLSDPHRVACKNLERRNIPPPYHLLRQHPWACGLWKYYIQIQVHSLSIKLVNAWGSIMSCAHLYSAVLEEELHERKWLDMRLLFALRDAKDFSIFFFGETRRLRSHYAKDFNMALGASAAIFASGCSPRLPANMTRSTRGPRGLEEMAPVMQTFKARYCSNNPRCQLRAQDVRRILEQCALREKTDKERSFPAFFGPSKPAVSSFSMPRRKVCVTSVLAILRNGVQSEILELAFDYLTFHRVCWHLLRSVRDKCYGQLVSRFGPTSVEEESQLPRITGYILAGYTEDTETTVLEDVATVLLGTVESNAGDIVRKVLGEKLGTPVLFQGEPGVEDSLDQTRKDSHF
ncbi:hypothetical protein BKA66DRAFT_409453 [Pyrenochaeta sp. MPI-SDFR-AT-0127]|nr:hypothetical protein BKA66DRAFT_409453 [Pyrenochaeta sp. MPI-SDFR-AT-0127]